MLWGTLIVQIYWIGWDIQAADSIAVTILGLPCFLPTASPSSGGNHRLCCSQSDLHPIRAAFTGVLQFTGEQTMFNCLCILMFVDSLVSKHQRLVYCRHFKNGKGTGRHHIKFCEYHFTNIDVKIGEDQLSPVTKLGLGWGRGGVLLPLSLYTATLLSHFRPKTGNSADKDQTQFWPLLQGRQASGQTVSSNGINKATSA